MVESCDLLPGARRKHANRAVDRIRYQVFSVCCERKIGYCSRVRKVCHACVTLHVPNGNDFVLAAHRDMTGVRGKDHLIHFELRIDLNITDLFARREREDKQLGFALDGNQA